MRLLASLCNAGRIGHVLAIVQFFPHRIVFVHDTADDCCGTTGIARTPFGYAIGCQLTDGGAALEFRDRMLHLISRYRCRKIIDVHSLAWHDGHLYAVSTGNNSIYRLQVMDGWVQSEELYMCLWNVDYDAMHLNSIAVMDGRFLVTQFGGRTEDTRWNGVNNGALLFLNPIEVCIEDIEHPHSATVDGRQAWFCESRLGRLIVPDHEPVDLGGYTRGLVVSHDFVFVGTSKSRHLSRSLDVEVEPLDLIEPCSVWIIKRSTLEKLDRFVLGNGITEIYDLAVL